MTAQQTLALLESLLSADDNLMLWRSHEDSGGELFFAWSKRSSKGLAKGKPTIGEALAAYRETLEL